MKLVANHFQHEEPISREFSTLPRFRGGPHARRAFKIGFKSACYRRVTMLTTQSVPTLRHPFGEVCCEDEVRILGDHYKEFFFDRAPFSDEALEDDRYLI